MLEQLERQTRLTGNQRRLIFVGMLCDMFEFYDLFLVGFVLAFVVGPWQLTYGQSAMILLSSGVGAILGAGVWGWLADRMGRRVVLMATVTNFSVATGILAFTPEHGWIFLSILRFFVGFGAGGMYCVVLPLVQEFIPSSKRGRVSGLVTAVVPLGLAMGAVMGAYLGPVIGWRGLFGLGVLPVLLLPLIHVWVPESPRWLLRTGRVSEARQSLAWALETDPEGIPMPAVPVGADAQPARWSELFRYRRSMAVSWLGNLSAQTGIYGLTLWVPTLFVQLFRISPAEASYLMIYCSVSGFGGRILFAYLSDAIGRRWTGVLYGFGSSIFVILAASLHNAFLGTISVFWLVLIVAFVFAEGGFALVGPYAAEVWPARLRATGMGSAYGFGGIGKIIGPLGLAVIIGSTDIVKPEASVAKIIPAFTYLGAWFALAGIIYGVLGIETKGRSIEEIDSALERGHPSAPSPETAVPAEQARLRHLP